MTIPKQAQECISGPYARRMSQREIAETPSVSRSSGPKHVPEVLSPAAAGQGGEDCPDSGVSPSIASGQKGPRT